MLRSTENVKPFKSILTSVLIRVLYVFKEGLILWVVLCFHLIEQNQHPVFGILKIPNLTAANKHAYRTFDKPNAGNPIDTVNEEKFLLEDCISVIKGYFVNSNRCNSTPQNVLVCYFIVGSTYSFNRIKKTEINNAIFNFAFLNY